MANGCGGTDSGARSAEKYATQAATSSAATPAATETKADADRDNDVEAGIGDDTNNRQALTLGREASRPDRAAIAALVKRYYAVAYAENGAAACSMIYSTLEEAVPEDYGQSPPAPAYMRGTTCPAVLALLFKHYHPQIALEYPQLTVASVRLTERHGFAVLRFGQLPEREIQVKEEKGAWKIDELLDGPVS